MTADEIRKKAHDELKDPEVPYIHTQTWCQAETAAQLSELNQNLHQLLDPRGEFIQHAVEEAILKYAAAPPPSKPR